MIEERRKYKREYQRLWRQLHPNYHRDSMRAYTKTYPGHQRECKKIWNQKHAQYIVDCQLKRRHGITLREYNKMFKSQKGRCLICDRHQRQFKFRLCVDHDHETGKIRGLLCNGCNRGLGIYQTRKYKYEKYLNRIT